MIEDYLRPRSILDAFSRRYPDAWRQVDDMRADRKRLGDWPDWCFLPLAGAYAIVSKAGILPAGESITHVGIVGALAAWRVTQGIYRFDPTTFDALWKTPVTGDIPTEVLFHLPEWCVYIPTPDQQWRGNSLHGVFAHLEHDMNDQRTELRLVLDISGPQGGDLVVMPLHLGHGGVSGAIEAMMRESARHSPVPGAPSNSEVKELSDDLSPVISLILYLCSQAADIRGGGTARTPTRPKPVKTKKGVRLFPPDRPTSWDVGYRLGAALRRAMADHETTGNQTGTHGSPRPHIRRAHWHSYWIGKRSEPNVRSAVLKWLPPIPVNVQDAEDLVPTVRTVAAD